MSSLFDRVFVIVVPAMIIGFLIGSNYPINSFYSYAFFTVVLGCIIASNSFQKLQLLIFPLLIFGAFLLGVIASNGNNISRIDNSKEAFTGIGEILEIKEGKWKQGIIACKYRLVNENKIAWDEKLLILIESEKIERGDVVLFSGDVIPIVNKSNPGEFDERFFWLKKGIRRKSFLQEGCIQYLYTNQNSYIGSLLEASRNWISRQFKENLEPHYAAIAHALILGDKHYLSKEEKRVFTNAGAMHVLAVSGLHIGIITYIIIAFLKLFKRFITKFQIHIIAIIIIWLYALMIDLPPSVSRSALMFSVLILGEALERKGNALNLLFFSAFILVLLDPYIIYDIGFQLSYLAMIGITCFYKPVSSSYYFRNRYLRKAWEATSIGIAAQITTFPLTLFYFHQFPNYFVISNLIVLLLAGAILGLGIAFIAFIKMPFVSVFIKSIFTILLSVLFVTMSWVDSIPGAVARGFNFSFTVLILMYLFLFALIISRSFRNLKTMIILVCLIIISGLQFNRFLNWNDEHLIVFNFNRPAVAIHKRNLTLILYESNSEKDERKIDRLIDDYVKIYPGTIHKIQLIDEVSRVSIGGLKVYAERLNYSTRIKVFDHEVLIRKSIKSTENDCNSILCLPYLNPRENETSLADGAHYLKL